MSRRALLTLAQRETSLKALQRRGWTTTTTRGAKAKERKIQEKGMGTFDERLERTSPDRPPHERLERTFHFNTFSQAFAFMTRVAALAEAMDHHPDWWNVYGRVGIALHTHAPERGLTMLDIEMAERIGEMAAGEAGEAAEAAEATRA